MQGPQWSVQSLWAPMSCVQLPPTIVEILKDKNKARLKLGQYIGLWLLSVFLLESFPHWPLSHPECLSALCNRPCVCINYCVCPIQLITIEIYKDQQPSRDDRDPGNTWRLPHSERQEFQISEKNFL